MIFKAKLLASAARNAFHIGKTIDPAKSRTAKWNDYVEVVCSHNIFCCDDLRGAAREMEAVASGSRAKKAFYAVAISPDGPGGIELSNEKAEYVAEYLLEKLGFSADHQWLLVRHEKGDRVHFHVLANRVHPVTLTAVHMSWNYVTQELVAREMEELFDLPSVPGVFVAPTKASVEQPASGRPRRKKPRISEEQQAERTAVPIAKVEADLRWAWEDATNGVEFRCRLAERGYGVAKGDVRDWVVVDEAGGVHSPARRLGIRLAELREKTADFSALGLPKVKKKRVGLTGLLDSDDLPDAVDVPPAACRPM